MLLMIDNYDSFTYNLVQHFRVLGLEVGVWRNDEISLNDILRLQPSHICLSPGPGTPQTAGITLSVVRQLAGRFPILGVCLGHQAIGEALGAKVVAARTIMHGKQSRIACDQQGLFNGLPRQFDVVRYHSLALARDTLPDCLQVTAWSEDGEIMAIHHRELALAGVQFHPESILSDHGERILHNFIYPSFPYLAPASAALRPDTPT